MAGNSNSGNRTGLPRAAGAGRKPSSRQVRWLKGDPKRNLSLVEPPTAGLVSPDAAMAAASDVPANLSVEEQAYWRLLAPLAISNGTLTEQTRPGFVLLCQVAKRAAQLWGEIEERGFTYEKVTVDGTGAEQRELKSHPLLTHYRGLMQRQEQLLARYGLAAMGKVTQVVPKKDDERDTLAQLMAIR